MVLFLWMTDGLSLINMAYSHTTTPSLFRYQNSKKEAISLLMPPPKYKRIVELYLGNGPYINSRNSPSLGVESNKDIADLWNWLKTEATEQRLREISEICSNAVSEHENWKPDVRNIGLSKNEQTYVRINICGLINGQLSSWKIQPNKYLPIEETISLLSRLQNVEILHGLPSDYKEEDGDIVIINPIFEDDNYQRISEIKRVCNSLFSPFVILCDTNAPKIFPEFNWDILTRKSFGKSSKAVNKICYVYYSKWK